MPAADPIRWTLERAAVEFDIDRKTLSKRVQKEGIQPGRDKKFSTAQVCTAIFGDLENEKLLLVREQRLTAASARAEREHRLVSIDAAGLMLEGIVVSLRQTIQHAPELGATVRSKLAQTLEININDAILAHETGDASAEDSAPDPAA